MKKQDIKVGDEVAAFVNDYGMGRAHRLSMIVNPAIVKAKVLATNVEIPSTPYRQKSTGSTVELLEDGPGKYGWRTGTHTKQPAGTKITLPNRNIAEKWETFGPARQAYLDAEAERTSANAAADDRGDALQARLVKFFATVKFDNEEVACPIVRTPGHAAIIQTTLDEVQIEVLLRELGF